MASNVGFRRKFVAAGGLRAMAALNADRPPEPESRGRQQSVDAGRGSSVRSAIPALPTRSRSRNAQSAHHKADGLAPTRRPSLGHLQYNTNQQESPTHLKTKGQPSKPFNRLRPRRFPGGFPCICPRAVSPNDHCVRHWSTSNCRPSVDYDACPDSGVVTTCPFATGSVGPGLNDVRTVPSLPSRR